MNDFQDIKINQDSLNTHSAFITGRPRCFYRRQCKYQTIRFLFPQAVISNLLNLLNTDEFIKQWSTESEIKILATIFHELFSYFQVIITF